ncbi:uncharacterized protein G2W53_039686 [Senna tora]|uniref:Uncharacterized protein n=1 Tax=Senna tora TaxID=362788 RepID=A0A834SRC5_9FABA|nr:uncharacterized protein G2W53_039686 [Senna tora]
MIMMIINELGDDHKYEAFREARTMSWRQALGITGRICRKSPPNTTTLPLNACLDDLDCAFALYLVAFYPMPQNNVDVPWVPHPI